MTGEGIHIRGVFLYNDENKAETMFRLEIWPLPADEALHQALNDACHEVTRKILIERGLSGEGQTDLTAKGPAQ